MNAFQLPHLLQAQRDSGRAYFEFLRQPSMSVGLYTLPAGAIDPQQPHLQDELYYILSGRATFQLLDEEQPVQPHDLIFVPAHTPHHFHTISEELTSLVFFAPAESA